MASVREAYVAQARARGSCEHWSGPPEMVERIAGLLGTSSQDLVLDVGCGLGGPARRLARSVGCRVLGVDLVEPVVRAAAERGGPVRYAVGRAEALPFGDATVDQVWVLGAMAHFIDLDRALAEAARVLRSGGALAATEAFWTSREEPSFAPAAPDPWRPLTKYRVVESMSLAGFAEVRPRPWPGGLGGPPPGDMRLAADLAAGRLRSGMVVGTRA